MTDDDARRMYGMPKGIDVRADGPLRIITLNRPDALNAVNDPLHTGLARLWPRLAVDRNARAAVLTGAGTAFSAGGDFTYLDEIRQDPELRSKTIGQGRDRVLGMVRCRVPVIAAVNGPAVGLGCSPVALSDIVYMAGSAYLADPHVQVGLVGLVAADGGPLTWPLHTSLLLAKDYALTGARIPAAKAVALGLANHVAADPLAEATACAKRIAGLPRQAAKSTKRVLNMPLERAVLATPTTSRPPRNSPSRRTTSATPSPGSPTGKVTRRGRHRDVSFHRWSAVPLSSHCRTCAPEDLLSLSTPSSSPLL